MIRNIANLYLVQFASYLVPLLLTPFLARTLGVEQFGIYAMCAAVVSYLGLLVSWGFDLSVSQQVAQSQNEEQLRGIFWDTMSAKVMLCGGGILAGAAITLAVPALRAHWPVMLASGLTLAANVGTANWFLQGLEKMGSFALAALLGRLLSLPVLFLLVHGPADTALAAGILSCATCVSGAASLLAAARVATLRPARFSGAGGVRQIREGARLFLSTAAISLYTYTNVLVLGLVGGAAQAGFFDGADRVKRAGTSLTGPLSNAMYPRINNMVVNSPEKVGGTMVMLAVAQGAITLVLSVFVFMFAHPLTMLLLGADYGAAVPIVKWLSANIFLIGLSNVLAINMMLPLGLKREFTRIVLVAGPMNVALLLVLAPRHGGVGAAIAVTVTEAVIAVASAVVVYKHRHRLRHTSVA